MGFLAPATGLFVGGAGGVGFALTADAAAVTACCVGLILPLTAAEAAEGTARGGAVAGGGGGGARACSISST
jgi:hypothetical protein